MMCGPFVTMLRWSRSLSAQWSKELPQGGLKVKAFSVLPEEVPLRFLKSGSPSQSTPRVLQACLLSEQSVSGPRCVAARKEGKPAPEVLDVC